MSYRGALVALTALAVATGAAVPARADWRVRSPDGRLSADLRLAGGLHATVRRDGARVLSAAIGLAAGRRCLPEGFAPAGHATSRVAEDYTTPAGKRRQHHHRARELVLRFRDGRSRLSVAVRAADDGIAFRTTLSGPARRRVTGECTAFTAPRKTRAWLQEYGTSYERPYLPTRLRDAGHAGVAFPALLSTGRAWALLSESGIGAGQPAARLALRSGVLRVRRPRVAGGLQRLRTPWRVAVIGSLGTIVASDLVDDLAPPARAGDWSWVRPGRVAWSWWADSGSPSSLTRQQQYVDFAARMGWEYVLVDDGWDPSWIPALTAYARERGVGVLLWSPWDALATPAQRDALLSQWRDWGVAGVKLDFMQSDSQARMRWYRDVAEAAAARHLVVDFHGATAPRGLSRTWPNVLTQEAVLGAEAYKSATALQPSAAHNATLPFTRNAIGPMDYTPVTFSTPRRRTSLAHELALSVVFASGLQHFADTPEAYAAQPIAERWLREVPVAWDETRLLGGHPGRSATITRRAGERWYVGAIRAGAGGTAKLALDFLPPGSYVAETIEDAPGGGLAARTRQVTAAGELQLTTGANGGYVVGLAPAGG
jgi:alpha-glucosidase